ncbi:MAG: formate/nitrite transporter family protein [Phycisphaerae bacterium]|nr:formate/nitrite transporter family protein [Phycisphaerae bacterium]
MPVASLQERRPNVSDSGKHFVRFDMLLPPEMAEKAAQAGIKKVQIDTFSMLLMSILAGIFIAMASNFYTAVLTKSGSIPFGIAKLLGGLAFCMGLILVVVAGAELFTGNNLIVMAVLSRKVGKRWLFKNWLVVFVGNLIGSILYALMVWGSGQDTLAGGSLGKLAIGIAEAKCEIPFWQAFFRGVLCNALVCLAIWMCFSSQSTTDRVMAILFPITAFVACGFEHCVANMYFISIGLFLKAGGAEVGENLTWLNFFWKNLLPVTLGNIVGGAGLVGFVFWMIYKRRGREPKYRDQMP